MAETETEGSDVRSNFTRKTETVQLTIKEPAGETGTEMWYQWLRYRIRNYMILEILFFIILVLILSNSYEISSQNKKTYELISNLQSQINSLEKRLDSNYNPKENETSKKEKMHSKTSTSVQNEQSIPSTNISISRYNAASFIIGARVDTWYSSSFNLNPFFGWSQSEYVLIDRKELPSNKAWCSYDDQPILTVKLAQYIKPTAVSYQHTKWNGTIPNQTPKLYDVVACLDLKCNELEPLVTNCQYRASKDNQEQICEIPMNRNVTSINKVQFHFRENYGNISNTCVSLVRVYGERSDIHQNKKQMEEDAEACSQLTYRYYNSPILYNLMKKNCTILYSMNCCTECPECCLECEIQDINGATIMIAVALTITLGPIILIMLCLFGCMIMDMIEKIHKFFKNKSTSGTKI